MEEYIPRFLAKVDKTATCWNWTATISFGGYGQFTYKSKNWRAHRYSYSVFVGPLVEGLVIDHLCSNRKCVNPEHLEQVTQQENISRAYRKREHCKYGHELDGIKTKDGATYRRCKTCHKEEMAEYY